MTNKLQKLVASNRFQYSVLALIILAAVLVGVETYPSMMQSHGKTIRTLNQIVLAAFVVEALLKMAQHGIRFYRYFLDPWNVFDFMIIAICFLPFNASFAAVLRLARVFRSLRLLTAIPKLQLLVNALLRSVPSMFYVGVLLLLLFYVYGVMGVFLFRDNDPVHFSNLPTSMLTLFRVVTQEDWTDVMYIQMYGSDVYAYDNTTDRTPIPSHRPLFGALFFVSFVFLGTMIMLNLFIGVIINSMEEAQKEKEKEHVEEEDAERALQPLGEAVDAIDRQLDEVKAQLRHLQTRFDSSA